MSPRAERKVHNVSQACDAQPGRINTSGDRKPRRTLRAEGRGIRYARTIFNAHHVSQACMQPPCAHHVSPRVEQIVNNTYSRCQRLSQSAGARRGLSTRPAWPRRTLHWQDHQRAIAQPGGHRPRHHDLIAAMHNNATARALCDAQRAAPRATDWAPRSSICDAQRAAPRATA